MRAITLVRSRTSSRSIPTLIHCAAIRDSRNLFLQSCPDPSSKSAGTSLPLLMTISLLSDLGARARHRVARRLLPFVFLIYVVNYLDRVNVSFANLRMSADLGFSDRVYGLGVGRSEEHTSELQSQFHLVCRLLLEKKK